jgi:Ca2+/H+ antiporter, TMEM165/GDT1 family
VEAFLVSMGVVALSEFGDKTQLLAIMLAARFRKPWPIIAGILTATLLNHGLAALLGQWIASAIPARWLSWALALSFFVAALWALKPDKLAEDDAPVLSNHGVFAASVFSFFLAEMGDKTQVATAMLAARFNVLLPVIAGTTIGMLIADVPAVFAGKAAGDRIPFRAIRIVAALLFVALGITALWQPGRL